MLLCLFIDICWLSYLGLTKPCFLSHFFTGNERFFQSSSAGTLLLAWLSHQAPWHRQKRTTVYFLQQFLQIRARFLVALGIVAPVAPAAAKRCVKAGHIHRFQAFVVWCDVMPVKHVIATSFLPLAKPIHSVAGWADMNRDSKPAYPFRTFEIRDP